LKNLLWTALICLLLLGCEPTPPALPLPGPALIFDLTGSGAFFDRPWPASLRTVDGKPDLSGLPNPTRRKWIDSLIGLGSKETDGFSPTGPIYFLFDGPVATPSADPLDRLSADSPILLVNIDPKSAEFGKKHLCHVRVTESKDSFRPANLLQILPVPGLGLLEHTRYAAIVRTTLGNPDGAVLAQHADLASMLAGKIPAGARAAEWTATLAPLVKALPELGLEADEIAAATVFVTGAPTATVFGHVRAQAKLPAPMLVDALALRDEYPTFYALKGSWLAPVYQAGTPPFIVEGGKMSVDATGKLIKVRDEVAPFKLAVPKGKMPAEGFPLYFYIHGTGGVSDQVIDRGKQTFKDETPAKGSGAAMWAAEKGWGASCTGLPLAPERLGFLSFDGYMAYNFFNPPAMRDNFIQMLLDLVRFRKLVLSLAIDPALCPGTDASASHDGKIRFDPAHVVVSGQSLGSYLAGMLTATLGGFEGAILTGAGGSWIEFPFGPTKPVPLQALLELLVRPIGTEPIDRFHPLVMLADLGLGPADNIHYAPFILRSPKKGVVPPHVLVIEGHDDIQVPTDLQRALILALGVDMAGSDPGPEKKDKITPVLPWGGQKVLSYPVKANVLLAGHGLRTAIMVRYKQDSFSGDGHLVTFNLPEPPKQIKHFLETLLKHDTPTVISGK